MKKDQYIIEIVAQPKHSNAKGGLRLRAVRDGGNWFASGRRFALHIDNRDVAKWRRV